MRVSKGKTGKALLVVAGILIVGAAGAFVALYFFNTSFVFYKPGQTTTIHHPSIDSEPLPFMPGDYVENIILFIGDGMGVSQLAAARIHFAGPDGRLNIERMPVTGLVTTHAVGDLITDSAASATALATGVKTRNSMVGVDSNGVSQLTILEAARDAGMGTGIVTSTRLTDATPAAFASHVPRRKMQAEIAVQLIEARVNVLFGDGAFFYPKSDPRSRRVDDIDPMARARAGGYAIVESKQEVANSEGPYLLGLFSGTLADRMTPEISPNSEAPSLAELTAKAIDVLTKNERGFFLMVEEEGTDKGGHVNREDYFLHYLKNLDESVKIALDFALQDRKTLVLVTSDHETGGMNIVRGSFRNRHEEFRRGYLEFTWDTDGHTAQPVPLFAFGPQAIRFTGLKDNTEIPKIMADLLQLNNFPR